MAFRQARFLADAPDLSEVKKPTLADAIQQMPPQYDLRVQRIRAEHDAARASIRAEIGRQQLERDEVGAAALRSLYAQDDDERRKKIVWKRR